MKVITQELDKLSPEIQKRIKAQLLMQRMGSYGKETLIVDDKVYRYSGFQGYQKMKEVIDFKELPLGCEMYIKDEKYPMRGCFDEDKVKTLTQFKKLIPTISRTLKEGGIFYKIIAFFYFRKAWKEFLRFIERGLRDVVMKPNFYNQPAREIYRVLSGGDEIRDVIRNILCSIIEFDTAYRYRFQDIISELNKGNFYKNPVKEIKRLLNILLERGGGVNEGITQKMGNFLPILFIYLKFNKKFSNEIKKIIKELNINELKLSKEDIYWTNSAYEEFKFRGIPHEQRFKEYLKEFNN